MPVNTNVGWSFPVRCNANGRVSLVGGRANAQPTVEELDAAVRTGAYIVLCCGRGSRVMLRHFGVGAERYLFQPLTHLMGGFLELDAREQLQWFARRSRPGRINAVLDSRAAEVVMEVQLQHTTHIGESVLKVQVSQA